MGVDRWSFCWFCQKVLSCAFRASVGGLCFVLTARNAGGSGRVTSHTHR